MHRGKLDYDEAIRELGLDPSTATAVDEIIRSTGRRLTSPFFLVEQPVEHRGRLRGHFLLSGVDRIPQEEIHLETTPVRVGRSLHERTLTSIKPHDRLFVLPEVRDEKQRQPLLVCANHNGTTVPVGRIPDYLVPPFHNLIEKTGDAKVFAHHVNSPGTVSHLRVLMLLDTPAPPCNPFEGL
ncbi:hypothetical protein ACFSSC_09870 [Corynebacterium mendelii]|uniref:Uncharacterized protein n=1 Tax=Corynebacterium mendelii TaxID=2765362 RepID=A0A939E424_9CORY|nr:hypothetical protein [Corynebacterium mendelii]MBN9645286.1 hypothetical protein [Corynebacterium mendelii]